MSKYKMMKFILMLAYFLWKFFKKNKALEGAASLNA